MANNDRVSKALENVIIALQELKDAWDEQQAAFVPQVIISDAPPVEVAAAAPEPAPEPAPFKPEPAPASTGPLQFTPGPVPLTPPVAAPVPPTPASPGVSFSEAQPAAPLPPEPSANVGRKCPLCGAVAEPTSKFCLMCGASLGDQPARMQAPAGNARCKKCGAELMPGDRFCIGCGTPVK